MSIKAHLFVEDMVYNVLLYNYNIHQSSDETGRPAGRPFFTRLYVMIEATRDTYFFEKAIHPTYCIPEVVLELTAVIPGQRTRRMRFLDCYITLNGNHFEAIGRDTAFTETVGITAAAIEASHSTGKYTSPRQETPFIYGKSPAIPNGADNEEGREKKWKTIFKPDNSELNKSTYGWDEWLKSLERNCTSDKTKYHNAYTRIEVDGEDYPVPILTMRKDQTITLQLDHTTRSKNEYTTVEIEPHPSFDIQPTDPIGAREVTIRCLATATNRSQIKVTADGNPAGMLEMYHPQPKTISLRWVFVEIEGDREDQDELTRKINKNKLEDYLKRALYPALIDVTIVNDRAEILDIPKLRALTTKSTLDQKGKYIKQSLSGFDAAFKEDDRIKFTEADKTQFLSELHRLYKADTIGTDNVTNEIVLFLTNLGCKTPNANDDYDYSNGISFTSSGISAMFMKNEKIQPAVEIPHEVLHAIALPHTFAAKDKNGKIIDGGQPHTFTKGTTKNYMDYNNTKKQTHIWQWDKLHTSKYAK